MYGCTWADMVDINSNPWNYNFGRIQRVTWGYSEMSIMERKCRVVKNSILDGCKLL